MLIDSKEDVVCRLYLHHPGEEDVILEDVSVSLLVMVKLVQQVEGLAV